MKKRIYKIKNADLKNYCSFKIGGKAKCIYFPENIEQTKRLINKFKNKKIAYFLLGNGTNILFNDKKFIYPIICLKKLNKIQTNGEEIVCGAGASLFDVNAFCVKNDLGGLEFTYGIPASVGGAVAMNAGAFGDDVCSHLSEIVVCKDGEIYSRQNLEWSYRKGVLKDGEILIYAKFNLKPAKKQQIIEKQQQFLQKRKISQPFGEFCAGSIFKRQGDIVPAKLIDEWGLKGLKIGGAMISQKHAGFIVNTGGASGMDVLTLIEIVEWIARKKGFCFEREIIVL